MNEREVVKLLPPREVVQFDPGGTRKLVRLPVFSSTSFHSRLMNTQNKHTKNKRIHISSQYPFLFCLSNVHFAFEYCFQTTRKSLTKNYKQKGSKIFYFFILASSSLWIED